MNFKSFYFVSVPPDASQLAHSPALSTLSQQKRPQASKVSPLQRKSPHNDQRFYYAPERQAPPPAGTPRKQKTKHLISEGGAHLNEPHIGWVIDSRDHAAAGTSANDARLGSVQSFQLSAHAAPFTSHATSLGSTPQSLPKFEHPSHSLLKENGFAQVVYHKYRIKCIKERKRLGKLSSKPVLCVFFSPDLNDEIKELPYET